MGHRPTIEGQANSVLDGIAINSYDVARFFSSVKITDNHCDCWEWQGAKDKNNKGYGRFSVDGREIKAHRFSFLLVNKTIPEGKIIRHVCDNTFCVNPNHLLLGTTKQNSQDMHERNRWCDRKGDKHPLAKLDADKVIEIRRMCNLGYSESFVAESFGVSRGQIYKIKNKINWGHIDD